MVREAGLNALRRDPESASVTRADFDRAMDKVKPSITSEMVRWYQATDERLREMAKPPMDIA